MRLVVCVKQVAAVGDEIEFDDGALDIDPEYLDWSLNEWDAYAIEEALRLRERHDGEVVAISAGAAGEPALRRALAMGVDRAIHVTPCPTDPLLVAAALAEAINPLSIDLVLAGAQSSDAAQGIVGSAIAAHLDLPCAAVVVRIDEWSPADRSATVVRELEGGLHEVLEISTPAVITVQTGINEPRYATLRAIKQAEAKEIEALAPTASAPAYTVRRMFVPSKETGARMLNGDPADVAAQILSLVREATA